MGALEPSGGLLGGLGAFWRTLGWPWGPLEGAWGGLGPSGGLLGGPGAIWRAPGRPWGPLEGWWEAFGLSRGLLGGLAAPKRAAGRPSGPQVGCSEALGPSGGLLGAHLGPKNGHFGMKSDFCGLFFRPGEVLGGSECFKRVRCVRIQEPWGARPGLEASCVP